MRVVASVGRMDEVVQIPTNMFVHSQVPQGLVLPRAQAVISSGHAIPYSVPDPQATLRVAAAELQRGVAVDDVVVSGV